MISKAICEGLKNLFLQSYGDPNDSQAGSFNVPATADWIALVAVSMPCLFVIRTLEVPGAGETKEVFLTFNDKSAGEGFRIPANSVLTLDNVSGSFYVRPVNPAETVNISYMIASKMVNK